MNIEIEFEFKIFYLFEEFHIYLKLIFISSYPIFEHKNKIYVRKK